MTRPPAQGRTDPAQRRAQGGAGRATANGDEHAMSDMSKLMQSVEAARESHIRAMRICFHRCRQDGTHGKRTVLDCN